MKKEIFNYNLLCKLNSLFFNSTLGAIAIKLILFKENPPLELMIYIYSLYSIQTATNGIQIASRHVVTNKIKKDYIEFLKNYKEMLSKFDLKNPLEVETMYCYALNNGYLSVDKNFAFDINIGKNDCFLLGSFVMTGNGVCRHISSMLNDIYHENDIQSSILSVYFPSINYDILTEDELKNKKIKSKEELLKDIDKYVKDVELYNTLKEFTENYYDILPFSIKFKEKSKIESIIGNHVINIAHDGQYMYYLDPTNKMVYRPNSDNPKIISGSEIRDIKIKSFLDCLLNLRIMSVKKNDNLKKYMISEYPTLPIEDESRIIESVKNICKSNQDIFEQFYKENCEIYQNVTNNISKLSRKK